MFKEEIPELKFESNRGRDQFIESVLNSVDNKITKKDIDEITDLLNFF